MLFGRRNALISSLKLFKFKALGKITEVCRQPNFNAAKRGWQPNGSGIQHRSPTREFSSKFTFAIDILVSCCYMRAASLRAWRAQYAVHLDPSTSGLTCYYHYIVSKSTRLTRIRCGASIAPTPQE
jgi:hypothetical protein